MHKNEDAHSEVLQMRASFFLPKRIILFSHARELKYISIREANYVHLQLKEQLQ